MDNFYLFASVITNIIFFLIWKKSDLFNLMIKVFMLVLAITGSLTIINTYHLIH